jgi:hypothetical protein
MESRTLEVGDGGGAGAGAEENDEAGAEARLQEDRRGVGGGHHRVASVADVLAAGLGSSAAQPKYLRIFRVLGYACVQQYYVFPRVRGLGLLIYIGLIGCRQHLRLA